MSCQLPEALRLFSPALPLAVAYSGGADSTALLLACADKWPGQVHAFHVHHGLQAAADDFEQHCQGVCAGLNLPLHVRRVDARPALGDSPEDAARRARYQALAGLAQSSNGSADGAAICDIALAQHADDQAETLLLALSRGAGLPGLSAMPMQWSRDGLRYHRPLLGVAGSALRDWLAQRGARWIEDPTNTDKRYTRNRIRAELLPVLQAVFPQFRSTLARSAAHAAQAQGLLLELAELDLAQTGVPPRLAGLQGLSRQRQANALRHWLRGDYDVSPSNAQLAELLEQVAACTTRAHQIRIKVGRGIVERRGQVLHWYNLGPISPPTTT